MSMKITTSIEGLELRKAMAMYFLSQNIRKPIANVRNLAKRYKTSVGSISNTIHDLEALQAVKVSRQGRSGSTILQMSKPILWNIIVDSPLVISLPMPSFPKCEGLATALYRILNNTGLDTYLIFIRGSYNRLKALHSGQCHASVMSVLAADQLCGREENVILELPPESFVTDHRVFYLSNIEPAQQKLRVGIDSDSFDIKYLTNLEFANADVIYQEVKMMQIVRYLQNRLVDAAIWNIDHMEPVLNENILSRPLSGHVSSVIRERDTSTAIVIKSEDNPTKFLLKDILKKEEILDIQNKVVEGDIVARY